MAERITSLRDQRYVAQQLHRQYSFKCCDRQGIVGKWEVSGGWDETRENNNGSKGSVIRAIKLFYVAALELTCL